MKTEKVFLFLFALNLFSVSLSFSQQDHQMKMNDSKDKNPAVLIPGLGSHHHPVSTKNEKAQKFFDQGLTLIYAFNHNEAIRSFQKAADLDPNLAMAYWGIAYALGPNYNLPADNVQRKQAYDALKKAIKHSEHATQIEKYYINAIAKRYSKDLKVEQSKLDIEFRKAMKELYQKYPNDLDAATLYAESMMVLKPWQLWKNDGTPAEGTEEIVSVLESVIKRNLNHPGANHYYIHTVEASKDPGRALNSAKILRTLVPAAGHLVHMPAHIFFRVGDYEGASLANVNGINSDESYINKYKPEGIYPIMYYNHNINFLSVSRMMEGRFADALKTAKQTEDNIRPLVKDMQMIEIFYSNPLMILISFNKWNDILNYPSPDAALNLSNAMWHYARGLAYSNQGKTDEAKNELNIMLELKNKIPADAVFGFNTAETILNLAENILRGNIANSEGKQSDAVNFLNKAIDIEDFLYYDEPPDWYPSVRLNLGKILYANENYAEAEKIFSDELKKYPHNGRGLFGLSESLKAQNKNEEAKVIEEEFKTSWKNADTQLSMSND